MTKPAKTCPHLRSLRAAFETSYGNAFRSGLLSFAIVPDLVRGLGFRALAAQGEGVDVANVLPKIEAAALSLLAELSPALAEV